MSPAGVIDKGMTEYVSGLVKMAREEQNFPFRKRAVLSGLNSAISFHFENIPNIIPCRNNKGYMRTYRPLIAGFGSNSTDPGILGVRRLNELLANEKRISAMEIQTVGSKGHDGFMIALVISD